jgi:hypothetical protein
MKALMLPNGIWTLSRRGLCAVAAVAILVAAVVPEAQAQTFVGGHIGFVLPLVTRVDGVTSNLSDNFSMGFPVGITVKGRGRMAFDMELVPSAQNDPRVVSLTVHPGLVWEIRSK